MPRQQGSHQRFQFDSLSLDSNSPISLFRQLEEQLRLAIWQGQLPANERLPSSRALAAQLKIARNTVINAYDQLVMEGFLVTAKGSGTRVVQNLPRPIVVNPYSGQPSAKHPVASVSISSHVKRALKTYGVPVETGGSVRPFRAHIPACNDFPNKQWAQLAGRRLRQSNAQWTGTADANGYYPLRQAIVGHLGAARGVSSDAEHVMVSAGTQQAVDLLAKLLIEPGDIVCFEEPGYTPAVAVFQMAGANVKFISVDEDGLDTDELTATVQKAKLIYVTPSSHFPLGVTMSQARRQALLEWAEQSGAVIIEDDYNGEYRYRGRPLQTLYATAEPGRVIYLGSFSKLLFPALRLGYMLVPITLMEPLAQLRWLLDRHSPTLAQLVLTDFINQGYFARHLRRMRMLYAERQLKLLEAVKDHLNEYIDMPPLDGGLHLVGWLKPGISEVDFLRISENAGIEVVPVSQYRTRRGGKEGVIMGYAAYSSEEISDAVIRLAEALSKG